MEDDAHAHDTALVPGAAPSPQDGTTDARARGTEWAPAAERLQPAVNYAVPTW